MDNLQRSELVIANVLGFLLETGLSNVNLDFDMLGLEAEFAPFFATSVRWLQDEGIIRSRQIAESDDSALIIGPILTAHGFFMMGKPIAVGDRTLTLATAVVETKRDEKFYTGLGDLGGGFVGGLLKSLGGN
ncbi:MAG: hypothetical protein P8O10_16530 [Pseudorhodobacter sp.]|nr:hypothetical protein [Pseudorhodobacter sp.]